MARNRSGFWADVDRSENWTDVEDDTPVHALASWNMLRAKRSRKSRWKKVKG